MQKHRNLFGGVLFIALIVAFAYAAVYEKSKESVIELSYREFIDMAEAGKISEVFLTDGAKLEFKLPEDSGKYVTDNPRVPELKEKLLLAGINVSEPGTGMAGATLQTVASFLIFAGAFYFVSKNMNKNNMKSAMAINAASVDNGSGQGFSFEDVAGNDEAKDGMSDIVDFIKNPEKYAGYGARMPRGIIFYGPPGTGKTLMAKAIAGEAGVPFYAVSGSDFVQMFVGVGAARVRDLFKKARESRKAVIFIDEIDALGKKRGGQAGGNDERDQTLNALLTEMSGFETRDGIIVIAATNRLDTLDEALLRPGRFDRQVEIGLPDVNARERILKLHAKSKPIDDGIDLRKLAVIRFISAERSGSEKKDRSGIKEAEKKITAYHEAGHALVAKLAAPENKVSKITIIPSTKGAGGFCINIPPDKMYYTKKELEAQIMVNFGGRAAEEIIFGADNVTTGASNDIEKASSIARDYVTKFGMSEKSGLMNPGVFNEESGVLSECKSLLEKLYAETKSLISGSLDSLNGIARELLVKETLNEDELDAILTF
ncbi:metalloprotease m41 ftsh [Holotrichia oblita]|nr:metalloprotease m41 ftsh [Holotrichia oblita]